MAKVLVDESCKETVLSALKALNTDIEKFDAEVKKLKPLVDAGYDNGEVQAIKNDILDVSDYINALAQELGAILSAYAGMDNAFARRLAEDRETYLSS